MEDLRKKLNAIIAENDSTVKTMKNKERTAESQWFKNDIVNAINIAESSTKLCKVLLALVDEAERKQPEVREEKKYEEPQAESVDDILNRFRSR